MQSFEFITQDKGHFRVGGRLDFSSVPMALEQSLHLFADQTSIELDFSSVESADSAGLALLIEWVSWARREHKQLIFRHVPKQIIALARISDVEKMMPLG